MPNLCVIVCTHNPHQGRLDRTLAALRAQTLSHSEWECLLIDNASTPPLDLNLGSDSNLRVIREIRPGLTFARQRGLLETKASICIFVDDDNALAPDYLETALRLSTAHPRVGAFGGRSQPEFETAPASWVREFDSLLALRDLGSEQRIVPNEIPLQQYPSCAPIGAGMVIRREAAQSWLNAPTQGLTDRRGDELTSGGDNDIVLALFSSGWDIAYFPSLVLTHLIPAQRIERGHLGALNRAIARSWIRVLKLHGICPWPHIDPWSVTIRQTRAWLRARAWRGDAAWVRWQGYCGHFEGLADINPRAK